MDTFRRTSATVRLAAAVLLVAASGCAGEQADAAAAVDIADSSYGPATLDVSAGQAVTWTNSDEIPHTVTFSDSSVESSDELEPGDEFTATFDAPGSYSYVCALHPDMSGSVTVSG